MPLLYLSPSLQPFNEFINGGNEQYYMNLIADEMEPFLITNGIQFERNDIGTSLRQAIAESNEGNYDLHLAIHSNSSPESLSGILMGTDVYYRPDSYQGLIAAQIIADNYKNIYPVPSLVKAVPTTTLSELNLTKAPAVLIETAYHDNENDANWIKENIYNIAQNLTESLTLFFDIPFIATPQVPETGIVTTDGGSLNIRLKPSTQSPVISSLPNGSEVTVTGRWEDWYVVSYGDMSDYVNTVTGYASADYITIPNSGTF